VVAQELWILYTPVSQNPEELPDFTYLFVPNYPLSVKKNVKKYAIISNKFFKITQIQQLQALKMLYKEIFIQNSVFS